MRPFPPTRKPATGAVLKRGHPMAYKLLAYWPFTEAGGRPIDVISRVAFSSSDAATKWSAYGQSGQAVLMGGVQGYASASAYSIAFTDPNQFTVAARILTTAAATTAAIWAPSNTALAIAVLLAATGVLQITSSGSGTISNTGNVVANGVWYDVVFTRTAAKANAIYLNGVPQTLVTNDTTSNIAAAGSKTQYVGARDSGNLPWAGKIEYVGIWDRALSAQEAMTLHVQPYAMLASYKRRMIAQHAATASLFRPPTLDGLSVGGSFFGNPLG